MRIFGISLEGRLRLQASQAGSARQTKARGVLPYHREVFAMTIPLRLPPTSLLVAGCLFGTSACEISDCPDFEEEDGTCIRLESLTKFEADTQTYTEDWSLGQAVTVDGAKGRIVVEEGETGKVSFEVTPFTYRGASFKQAAIESMDKNLQVEVNNDRGGSRDALDLKVTRDGGKSELGGDIRVLLPPEFDGGLQLRNRAQGSIGSGHSIEVRFSGAPPEIWVENEALEPCTIDARASVSEGRSTVTHTHVQCEEEISVTHVSDTVDLSTSFLNAEIKAALVSVAETAPDSRISTEDGDVTLTLPSSGGYVVQAMVTEEGAIRPGEVPEDCNWNAADEEDGSSSQRSGTLSCGDGPTFQVVVGKDGVGESFVTLRYD